MAQCNGALGRVDFAVQETASGRELGSGSLFVEEDDIRIEPHQTAENQTYYRKTIRLTETFRFAIDEHPDQRAEDLKGFAMMAMHDEVQTYSWEWFNMIDGAEAVKLQEEGRIAIEVGKAPCGWEVVRTEFLTDGSVRMTRFFGDPTQEPFYRTTIRQGSWIAWPAGG